MPEYPYGGNGTGTGPKPLHMRITPAELAQACGLIRAGSCPIVTAFTISCQTEVSRDAVFRSKKAGKAALDKREAGETLNEREVSALAFYHELNKAFETGTYRLNRQALMDPEVAIGKEPDTKDANGKTVKGKMHYADPRGGANAYSILVSTRKSFTSQAALMDDEEEAASTAPREPTEEEREAYARAYFASKGWPFPEATPDAYDPTDAAPAQKL